jgi:hypothetical protein
MTDATRTSWTSNTAVHVAFGFFIMGGWAMFANRHHPLADAALAGVVQGTISGSLTLVLKKFLEWINARFAGLAALLLPPLVTATSILLILVGAHALAGTPEIAATVAVPFTVSTGYAIIYNLRLWRDAHGRR